MTHNSVALLPGCVDALSFCDEIVIVDDRSTDGTIAWAREKGLRVEARVLDNLPNQRRFQRDTARGEWLLIIDVDERVTPELATEIRALVDGAAPHDAYFITQRNVLPEAWPTRVAYTTSQKRLLRRTAVDWEPADWVHAPVKHRGRAGRLRGELLHASFDSVPHLLKKQLHYGLSTGRHLHRKGARPGFFSIARHSIAAFLKFYFLRGLVWQGTGGFIVATSLSISAFVKYATAWELRFGEPTNPRDRVPGQQ